MSICMPVRQGLRRLIEIETLQLEAQRNNDDDSQTATFNHALASCIVHAVKDYGTLISFKSALSVSSLA
jgi:hypothetical protein